MHTVSCSTWNMQPLLNTTSCYTTFSFRVYSAHHEILETLCHRRGFEDATSSTSNQWLTGVLWSLCYHQWMRNYMHSSRQYEDDEWVGQQRTVGPGLHLRNDWGHCYPSITFSSQFSKHTRTSLPMLWIMLVRNTDCYSCGCCWSCWMVDTWGN